MCEFTGFFVNLDRFHYFSQHKLPCVSEKISLDNFDVNILNYCA